MQFTQQQNVTKQKQRYIWPSILFFFFFFYWVAKLRKQPTFYDATTAFPAKWRLRNDCRSAILTRCHYPGVGSASDWVVNALTKKHYPYLARTSSVWNFCADTLGPVHAYPDIFKSATFSFQILKSPRPPISGYFWIRKFFFAQTVLNIHGKEQGSILWRQWIQKISGFSVHTFPDT